MTREEAINELKILREEYWDDDGYGHETKQYDDTITAIDMAIKVLEQEPDTWSLEDAREDFVDDVYNTLDFLPTNDEANQIIDSFDRVTSSIRREPCEDCISREEAKQFLYERIDRLNDDELYDIFSRIIDDMYNELPPVTPSYNSIKTELKSCEDCISRQRVLNDLENVSKGSEHPRQAFVFVDECVDYITSVPSVTPKYTDEEIDRAQAVEQAYIDKMVELAVEESKKVGHWIVNKEKSLAKCSNCKFLLKNKDEIKLFGTFIQGYNYCPYCGAKMIEPQDKTKQGLAYADQDTLMSAT